MSTVTQSLPAGFSGTRTLPEATVISHFLIDLFLLANNCLKINHSKPSIKMVSFNRFAQI